MSNPCPLDSMMGLTPPPCSLGRSRTGGLSHAEPAISAGLWCTTPAALHGLLYLLSYKGLRGFLVATPTILASPRLAPPCLALPRLALPSRAAPCLERLRAVGAAESNHRKTIHPVYLALPYLAKPCHAMPRQAEPRRERLRAVGA